MNNPKRGATAGSRAIRVRLCLWLRRGPKKEGKGTVYLRLRAPGHKERNLSTGVEATVSSWDRVRKRIKGTSPDIEVRNAQLAGLLATVHQAQAQLISLGRELTPEAIIQALTPEPELPPITLVELYERIIAHRKAQLADHTARTYGIKLAKLKSFLEVNDQLELLAKDFGKPIARQYETFIRETGCGQYYAARCVKQVRQVLDWGVENDMLKANPLQGIRVEVPRPEEKVPHLEDEHLEQLERMALPPGEREVADCFLFQCYTGLSYCDMARLDARQHIQMGIDANQWIFQRRGKSGVMARVPLAPQALELLERYNYRLPIKSLTHHNRVLKGLSLRLGLLFDLTTHVGRKTAGMRWLNSGVSIETVAAMLGHTSIRVTEKIYAKVKDHRIAREWARKIA